MHANAAQRLPWEEFGYGDGPFVGLPHFGRLEEEVIAVEHFCTLKHYLLMYVTGNCISIMIYLFL